ncbi:MAG: Spi family protease inhibitor, partial [Bacteroidaceae bacterium]|nr:Spi family protease inhibitor [Bacteroidaceae bacterium]
MKKLTLLFTLMSVALTLQADPITRAKAMQLAQEFMVPGYQMSLAIEAPTRRAAAATATEATAPYYVISRGENQGYVIIAGDDCLPEVLGYTDHGNFDASNLPPALQEMLDTWQNIVETTQANGTNVALAAERKATRRAASGRVDIAPFVTSHWG